MVLPNTALCVTTILRVTTRPGALCKFTSLSRPTMTRNFSRFFFEPTARMMSPLMQHGLFRGGLHFRRSEPFDARNHHADFSPARNVADGQASPGWILDEDVHAFERINALALLACDRLPPPAPG